MSTRPSPPPPSPRAHGFFITCSTVQQHKVFCPSPSLHLICTICSIQPCVAAPPPTDLSTRTLTVSGASAASSRPSQGKSIGAVDASESREGGESASPGAAAEGETLVLLRLPSRSTIKRAFLSDATLDDVRAFVRNSPEYVFCVCLIATFLSVILERQSPKVRLARSFCSQISLFTRGVPRRG